MSIYDLLKQGETVTVRNTFNDKEFQIQPETWAGIVMGYSVIEDGHPVKDHYRKLLDSTTQPYLFHGLIVVSHEKGGE